MTPTPVPIGPIVSFFGVAEADGRVPTPVGMLEGAPIYPRTVRQGFLIVVEGRPGPSGRRTGASTFNWDPGDPASLPDLQIVTSRPLGNGSAAVCDTASAPLGGVPAVDPPVFAGSQAAANAINDLACRFGEIRRGSADACTREAVTLDPAFANNSGPDRSMSQFCIAPAVGSEIAFPPGDTRLTVRLRDVSGNPGEPASMIVRVAPGS